DVGARPAIAGEHTGEDHFAPLVGLEAPFDACFGRAQPDERGVGTPPEEQLDRLDEQRLAGTGLAGDRGAAGIEQHGDVVDDPEVSDVELAEHGRHRSARPNLAFRIWWKSRGPNVTTRAGFGPAVQVTVSPESRSPSSRPSRVIITLRSSATVKRSSSSASSTSDRSKSMCGDTGVKSRHRSRGDTIGPRAENEYAVEPVGVATITPSAAYVVKNVPLIATSRRARRPWRTFSITASLSAHQRPRAAPSDATSTSSTMRSSTSNSPAS